METEEHDMLMAALEDGKFLSHEIVSLFDGRSILGSLISIVGLNYSLEREMPEQYATARRLWDLASPKADA